MFTDEERRIPFFLIGVVIVRLSLLPYQGSWKYLFLERQFFVLFHAIRFFFTPSRTKEVQCKKIKGASVIGTPYCEQTEK